MTKTKKNTKKSVAKRHTTSVRFSSRKKINNSAFVKFTIKHRFLFVSIMLFIVLAAVLAAYGAYFAKLPSADCVAGRCHTWDYYAVLGDAMNGDAGEAHITKYVSTYPNNILIYLTLKLIVSFGGAGAVWVVNGALLLVAALFLFLVAKDFSRKAALVIPVAFTILLAQSGYAGQLYTDTAGLFCIAAAIFIFHQFLKRRTVAARVALLILLAIVLSAGYMYKPTIILLVVGAILALCIAKMKVYHKFIYVGVLALATIGVIQLGQVSIDTLHAFEGKTVSQLKQHGFPATHFFKLGTQGNYQYNADTVKRTRELIERCGKKCAEGENLQDAFDNVASRTVFGNVSFFSDKMTSLFIDPYFHWHKLREETGCSAPESEKCTVEYLMKDDTSNGYRYTLSELQNFFGSKYIVWGLVIFGAAVTMYRRRKNPLVAFLGSSILFFLAYQLIGESHARYLICFLPCFILLAALSFSKKEFSYDEKK